MHLSPSLLTPVSFATCSLGLYAASCRLSKDIKKEISPLIRLSFSALIVNSLFEKITGPTLRQICIPKTSLDAYRITFALAAASGLTAMARLAGLDVVYKTLFNPYMWAKSAAISTTLASLLWAVKKFSHFSSPISPSELALFTAFTTMATKILQETDKSRNSIIRIRNYLYGVILTHAIFIAASVSFNSPFLGRSQLLERVSIGPVKLIYPILLLSGIVFFFTEEKSHS